MSISGNHSGAEKPNWENHSTKKERGDKAHEGKDSAGWPLVVLDTVSSAMDASASNLKEGVGIKTVRIYSFVVSGCRLCNNLI